MLLQFIYTTLEEITSVARGQVLHRNIFLISFRFFAASSCRLCEWGQANLCDILMPSSRHDQQVIALRPEWAEGCLPAAFPLTHPVAGWYVS